MGLISKLYGTKDLSHFSFEFYKKEKKKAGQLDLRDLEFCPLL